MTCSPSRALVSGERSCPLLEPERNSLSSRKFPRAEHLYACLYDCPTMVEVT
ncbi:hypothetical protein LR013_02175 [candidate division NPL-UPA2 bacterium]|nr:hypothetical protein [candidate division NPL-UPA2 bacterium]